MPKIFLTRFGLLMSSTIVGDGGGGSTVSGTGGIFDLGPGVWTWFNSPTVISLGGGRIAASMVDSENNPAGNRIVDLDTSTGAILTLNTASLGAPQSGGFSISPDDHNSGALAHLSGGNVVAMMAGHPSNGIYVGVSDNPGDPTSISVINDKDADVQGSSYTYANLYELNGDLYSFGRTGTSPGTWYYTKSTDGGATWSVLVEFVVGSTGYSPYLVFWQDTDKLHFLVTDGHPRDVSNNVYHGYFDATTDTFHKTDGTSVSVSPVPNPGAWSLAYDGSTTNAWVWDITVAGTEVFGLISTYGGGTDSAEYRRLHFDGASWSSEVIWEPMSYIYSSSSEEHYLGGLCFDPSSVDTVWASISHNGFPRWSELRKMDRVSAGDWSHEFVSGSDWKSVVNDGRVGRPMRVANPDGIAFWGGSYPSFDNPATRAGFFLTSEVTTRQPGVVSARAWRLRVLNTENIPDSAQISDIEFRETIGGVDFTDSGPGSAIASSVFSDRSDLQPEFAFNGSTGDRWGAQGTYDQWVGWDSGAGNSFSVAEVVMTEYPSVGDARPTLCLLEYSNDLVSWAPYAIVPGTEPRTGRYHNGGTQVFQAFDASDLFTPVANNSNYRFIKLVLLSGGYETVAIPNTWVIEYMTLRNGNGDNLCDTVGGESHASYDESPNSLSNLFVDNTSLWYSGDANPGLHHVMWDFGAGNEQTVVDIQLRCRASGSPLRMPQMFMVLGSNTGIQWDTLAFEENVTWSQGQTQTFALETSGVTPIVMDGFQVTVSATKVPSALTGYPLMIDLSDMPQAFWDSVLDDGGNVRVYAADGTTMIPHDLTYINASRKIGRLFARTDLSASVDTNVIVALDGTETAALPVTDTNGRNAVWADYEVVWVFPEDVNRTGKSYPQQTGNILFHSEWLRTKYHSFTGSPHQGISVESAGRVITIDTDYLRRYDVSDLATEIAENSTPIADSGIAGVNHIGDGCVVSGELFLPLEEYPNSPYDNQHIAVYDADTLAFLRSYDISANGHEVSGIAHDGTDLWITDFTDDTVLYRYSTTGTLLETVSLSENVKYMQGLAYVEGAFFVSSDDTNEYVKEVAPDGTVKGTVLERPTSGANEGVSFDGTQFWLLDGNGDVTSLKRIDRKFDWRKVHYAPVWADIDPRSDVWTMASSVYWTAESRYLQQAFLSYANGATGGNRASVVYDDGPDVLGMWNSSNSWMRGNENPASYDTFRIAGSHNGVNGRKLWVDGVLDASEGSSGSRPAGTGTLGEFVFNASVANGGEIGEAYYQFTWLRHEAMPDAWMEVEAQNMNNPSGFYTVAAV